MIVGTAGHIDHGKTSLVKALTGVDTDRLIEEKKRGMTIELGFAQMLSKPEHLGEPSVDSNELSISFIDVPGHEKLVKTMLAGASGIDFALLLIAADDGVMPQTLEHLSILNLLHIQSGCIVITKTDQVDETLLAQRRQEIITLKSQFAMDGFEILPVSSHTGEGIQALRALLLNAALKQRQSRHQNPGAMGFRMGLDRAFTLDGIGTVVAGSIQAGEVKVGDFLALAHEPHQTYRVRSLQVHGHAVEKAQAGERCAIALVGLEKNQCQRGQMLCAQSIATSTSRLDVWLEVSALIDKPLRSGASVHVHAQTQEAMATVAVLAQDGLLPGQSGWVQLIMHQPIHLWVTDRIILRDASATRTLAGGVVCDVRAPKRYRQTPERMSYLKTQLQSSVLSRLEGGLPHLSHGAVWSERLLDAGIDPKTSLQSLLKLQSSDEIHVSFGQTTSMFWSADQSWVIADGALEVMKLKLENLLAQYHQEHPDALGILEGRARKALGSQMSVSIWGHLTRHLMELGAVKLKNGFLFLPKHAEGLQQADQRIAQKALPLIHEGKYDPPWVRDLSSALSIHEVQMRMTLIRLASQGDLYQIVKDLFYHPVHVQAMAQLVRDIAQSGSNPHPRQGVSASQFRDATGLGRKRAIQILEFFDKIGFCQRVGEVHLIRVGTTLFSNPNA